VTHPFGPRSHPHPLCRVVLVEPLIPENTGNISRTCVGTESELHLIEPMGFELSEKRVRRAGLDYWPDLAWQIHGSYEDWRRQAERSVSEPGPGLRPPKVFYVETGGAQSLYEVEFERGDWLVFGKETSGLTPSQMHGPDAVRNSEVISIPMPGNVRSFNLSNAVAISVFELFRQTSRRKP
jgi:tRNA (cytidine/uridine-2'-O-)-methyltransferase